MMATRIRMAVLVVSVLAALLIAAVLVAWLIVDTDQVKKRIETRLSDILNLDVQIGQPLHFGLLQGPSVTIAGLELSRHGQVVATAESVSVGLATFSLLTGNVPPIDLHIKRPELMVERTSPGVFNFYEPEPGERDALSLRRLQVSDARITYLDKASEMEWLFEHCDLDLSHLHHDGGMPEQVFETLAIEGDLQCDTLSQGRFKVSELSAKVRGDNGVFELKPMNATAFEGEASGWIEANLSSPTPALRLEYGLAEFDFGAFMGKLNPDQAAAGKVNLELTLNAQGNTWQDLRQSATGMLSLRSGELTIEGYDLDDELEDYTKTQNFNLIDVGAVFIAGPVGLVVTRGYAFTGMLQGSGGSTTIDQMISEWAIEGGVAQARDVAFRTPQNRLALTGSLDFVNYRFQDMQVAVIDSDGCAVVEQRITGPFHEPEIEQPNVLVAVTGPMLDLVKRGVRAITGGDCETFYAGSMPHP
ncbi:AsmA family protein [Marinobacter lipolyticus]|nr:AsmA family protein [Marinobacter lipolyticus]